MEEGRSSTPRPLHGREYSSLWNIPRWGGLVGGVGPPNGKPNLLSPAACSQVPWIATPRWHEKSEHLPAMPDGATFHTVHTSEMRL